MPRLSFDRRAGSPSSSIFTPEAISVMSCSFFTASSDGALPFFMTMPSRANRC